MTVGTDLTAVIIAVILLLVFTFTLSGIYRSQQKEMEDEESFRELLEVAKSLQNGSSGSKEKISGVGVLESSHLEGEISRYLQRLRGSGGQIQVEIRTLERETLYRTESTAKNLETTFSIPIVYRKNGKDLPAFLMVRG